MEDGEDEEGAEVEAGESGGSDLDQLETEEEDVMVSP